MRARHVGAAQAPDPHRQRQDWRRVVSLDALVEHGMIGATDPDCIFHAETVDEAYRYITGELLEYALAKPGGRM